MSRMAMGTSPLAARIARGLETAAFLLLIVVVATRPLISESYDSAATSMSQAIEGLEDPSPARTLGFDLAIVLGACLWLLSFAFVPAARFRWTGLEAGLVLLALAGGVSCWFAGNKRLAINGTVDWLCLPILAITLVQVLKAGWQCRLALAAILATAVVNAAQCYEQYFVGFAETIELYEAGREEFWARQGVDLDSTTVIAFERRLRAREATGFFAHSNVAGAYLMLCAFAAVGVASLQFREGRPAAGRGSSLILLLQVIFTLAIAGAVVLAGSLAALVSGAAAIALLALAWRQRERLSRQRRRVLLWSLALILCAAAALFGYGAFFDALPGWSLTFRWQYWKASAALIADHFWTGVGRENFGRHYTLYKQISSPEEVANPHNLFVQAAAEWGVLGLLSLLVMLLGVLWRAASTGTNAVREELISGGRGVGRLLLLGVLVVAVRVMLLGTTEANYVYYSAVTTGLIWFPAGATFFWTRFSSPALVASFLQLALGVGLVAFLLQDHVNFAFYIPASATTFFAILGIWLSSDESGNPPPRGPGKNLSRWMIAASGMLLAGALAAFVLAPVYRTGVLLERARNFSGPDRTRMDLFLAATRADRLDPTPWVEQARWLSQRAQESSLQAAVESLEEAMRRDPYRASIRQWKSQLHLAVARQTQEPADFLAAIEAVASALALYPQDPSGLVALGDAELAAGTALESKGLLQAAAGHYQEALDLDAKRLEWETIQRLQPRAIQEIEQKIRAVEAELAQH